MFFTMTAGGSRPGWGGSLLGGLGYVSAPAPGALFDEHSVSWRLVSRWTVLAGGQAAVLLQVGHPAVGAGVAQHSSYATDPFGRLERTLYSMLAISFGSPERREDVLAELRNMHRPVTGTDGLGESYRALDPDLQRWVWATLIWVALEVERKYIGDLTPAEREQYYAESKDLARCFRIPESMIPDDLAAFEEYVAVSIAALVVTDDARAVAREIASPKLWWAPTPVWAPLGWVTADLLGPELTAEFGLRPLSGRQAGLVRRGKGLSRAVLPRLPAPLLANPLNRRAIA